MVATKTDNLKELDIPADILRYGHCPVRCGDKRLILEFYLEMVANGTSPRMAESLALQEPPGIGVTDTTFIADQNRHGLSILDRMGGDERAVNDLKRRLALNGYKLKPDDHYIPTVARFSGDPQAIVNNTQTMSDLKKKLKARGTAFHGEVTTEGSNSHAPRKRYRLNPRIVERIDQENLSRDPGLVSTPKAERYEAIVEKHGSAPQKG